MMNPPKRNTTRRANDPNVFAITIDRPTAPMKRKRPSAIWWTMNMRSMWRKNLEAR